MVTTGIYCNTMKRLSSDNSHSLIRSVNDKIVMVARKSDLRLIPADGAVLYADGTFQYAPRFFKQMYSFSIFKDGYYIPIAHFLVQNKTAKT